MAIAFGQSKSAEVSGTSNAMAFAANTAAGSLLIATMRLSTTGRTVTVTDTQGLTWTETPAGGVADGNGSVLYAFWAKGTTAAAETVTISISGAGDTLRCTVQEYTGFTNPVLDQTINAVGNSAAPASGAVTTTAADELIFAVMCNAGTATVTAGSGFTLREQLFAAPNTRTATEDKVVAATGSYNGDFTQSASNIWAAIVLTFKEAAAASRPRSTIITQAVKRASYI